MLRLPRLRVRARARRLYHRLHLDSLKVRSAVAVAAYLVALFVVRVIESDRRFTFGDPHNTDLAVFWLIVVLAVTHVVLSVVMWAQRGDWLPSEAAMFRFMAVKAIFWSNAADQFAWSGIGWRLDTIVLFVAMATVTVDLDVRLFRRYILGKEDADILAEANKP